MSIFNLVQTKPFFRPLKVGSNLKHSLKRLWIQASFRDAMFQHLWWSALSFFLILHAVAPIVEVRLQRILPSSRVSQLLQAPKGHHVELNFTLKTSYPIPCIDDMYLEVRDGYKKSASLLGRFCGRKISGIVRSSGQNLWLRFSYNDSILWFSGYYQMTYSLSNKTANTSGNYCLNEITHHMKWIQGIKANTYAPNI